MSSRNDNILGRMPLQRTLAMRSVWDPRSQLQPKHPWSLPTAGRRFLLFCKYEEENTRTAGDYNPWLPSKNEILLRYFPSCEFHWSIPENHGVDFLSNGQRHWKCHQRWVFLDSPEANVLQLFLVACKIDSGVLFWSWKDSNSRRPAVFGRIMFLIWESTNHCPAAAGFCNDYYTFL